MADPADVKTRSWRRIRQWPTWAKALGAAVAVWWVAGWTLPQYGRVVDESTGQPVADAYVVRYWNTFGMTMAGGRPSCIAFRVAKTDGDGAYFITPAWAGVAIRRDPLLQAMRNGFMVYAPGRTLARVDTGWKETIRLKPASASGEERLDELYRYFNLNACGSDRELKRKALGLYKALYAEAVKAAPPSDSLNAERGFRMEVEALEIGREKALERRFERAGGP